MTAHGDGTNRVGGGGNLKTLILGFCFLGGTTRPGNPSNNGGPMTSGRFYEGSPGVWPGEGEVHQHRIFELSVWVRSDRAGRTSPTSRARRSGAGDLRLPRARPRASPHRTGPTSPVPIALRLFFLICNPHSVTPMSKHMIYEATILTMKCYMRNFVCRDQLHLLKSATGRAAAPVSTGLPLLFVPGLSRREFRAPPGCSPTSNRPPFGRVSRQRVIARRSPELVAGGVRNIERGSPADTGTLGSGLRRSTASLCHSHQAKLLRLGTKAERFLST
jgi:hypothetical protein